MPGIEFLPDHPGDAEAEELLDTAPRRRFPRRLGVLLVAAVAATGVVVAGLNRGDDSAPAAHPAGSRTPASPVLPTREPLVLGDAGAPLEQGSGAPVAAVAMAGDSVWLLQARGLIGIHLAGRTVRAAVPGPPLISSDGTVVPRLELDLPARRLWVVVAGGKGGRVLEYDAYTLRLLRDIRSTAPVNGSAAMGGQLYVVSAERLFDVAADGTVRAVARVDGTLFQIVADPARDRLLMTDIGQATRIWAVTPRAGTTPRLGAPVSVAVTKAGLAVAHGAIWLGGFDTGAGVLMRLDPSTLHPIRHSQLDRELEPGAVVVAGGADAIWVRDGGDDTAQLRCVDAVTGRQLQTWNVGGPVASVHNHALVATTVGAAPLRLARCPG